MSITIDTLLAIRHWQRDHNGTKPDVVYLSETRLRAIAGEALPSIDQATIDRMVDEVRAGEDWTQLDGVPLLIDDALAVDAIQPALLPRAIYTGIPGGRMVGPEDELSALQAALNDPALQVAFDPNLSTADGAQMLTAKTMLADVGVDHPVLVLPAAVRAQWLADPGANTQTEYTGQLPNRPPGGRKSFGLVKPGGN